MFKMLGHSLYYGSTNIYVGYFNVIERDMREVTQIVFRLAPSPSLKMHFLASSTPWLSISSSPSCVCTHEWILSHLCSLIPLSSTLQWICFVLLMMSERHEEGVRWMQRCPCSGRDSVCLAVWDSYGNNGAAIMKVER